MARPRKKRKYVKRNGLEAHASPPTQPTFQTVQLKDVKFKELEDLVKRGAVVVYAE